MNGSIYYIAAHEFDIVKIGYTAGDPDKRLRSLQTGCPYDLVLVAVHEGTQQDERALHEAFAADRVRGEWFAVSQPLFQHIIQVIYRVGIGFVKDGVPTDAWPQWLRDGVAEITQTLLEAGAIAPETIQ